MRGEVISSNGLYDAVQPKRGSFFRLKAYLYAKARDFIKLCVLQTIHLEN